jgi:hypothetical protein
MPRHRFDKGDSVVIEGDPSRPNVRAGLYTVVRPLPIASSGLWYRIRSPLDLQERVVDETWMRPADKW